MISAALTCSLEPRRVVALEGGLGERYEMVGRPFVPVPFDEALHDIFARWVSVDEHPGPVAVTLPQMGKEKEAVEILDAGFDVSRTADRHCPDAHLDLRDEPWDEEVANEPFGG